MKSMDKLFGIAMLLAVFFACDKQDDGTGRMTVKMTDAPVEYDSVFVDVQSVEIHYANNNTGNSGWVTLSTAAGIYNLLELQSGVTAVLSDSVLLPAGQISQMRLILGNQNSVVVEGQSFPLLLSSQDETGLKFNLNTTISDDDVVEVLIDFDAEQSIVEQGNGAFRLKPVIKVESIIYL